VSETDLIVVAIASLVGSFVKSVTGMGYPLVAIPILTLYIGVESAVVVVALPNVFANLLLNLGVRAEYRNTRDLPILVVSSILGAIVGTFVLVGTPEQPLLIGLALSIGLFVIQRLRSPELELAPATTRRWAPVAGSLAGFVQGAVGISGPVVAMWLHGYRLPKNAYVYSVTAIFLVSGLTQLIVLVFAGEYGRDRLIASGVALISTLCMIPIGTRLRSRISGATFERLILLLLVISSVSLVLKAFR